MTGKGWEYSNTIITHGMEKVYMAVPTPAYRTYIKNYIDAYVNSSGAISATLSTLDRIHPGISVLFLYEQYKGTVGDSIKYRTAATTLRNVLVGPSSTYSKTSNGIFWHKLTGYNNISMLDGMYMAHPFLAKYGRLFNDNAAIDTAVNQTLFAYNQLYDNTTHLIKHAWTSTPGSYTWANGVTGNSSEVWSRAMGWYVMALTDILKYLPAAHPKRPALLTALSNLAVGINNYQDATTGLWYQVVDKGIGHTGYTSANYIETSGSAMFVYALKTAVDSGWLPSATYLPVAQKGWNGLKSFEITTYAGDGKPQINNFAPAMSVQNDYTAYTSILSVDCPTTTNPHGYAAILMAAAVMEFPLSLLPVHFTSVTAKAAGNRTDICWQNTDNGQAKYFLVQKSADGKVFSTLATMSVNNTGSYCWSDDFNTAARSYYRIAAASADGLITYSNGVLVSTLQRAPQLSVNPNPVTGKILTMVVNIITPGKYNLKIIAANGMAISYTAISLIADQNTVTIALPETISKGFYHLQIEGAGTQLSSLFLVN